MAMIEFKPFDEARIIVSTLQMTSIVGIYEYPSAYTEI